MFTSGLTAAKLDFLLPVACHNISDINVVMTDLENIGIAVETSLISNQQAEKSVLPV
jgi:hypothetical protein